MSIAVGDWINSYSPGIWKVYRVLPVPNEMRFRLSDRRRKSTRVIIFSKRLFDASWEPAFKEESCNQTLAQPLSESDMKRLDRALNQDPELASAFERYVPEPTDLIVNLTMRVPAIASLERFCSNTLSQVISSGIPMEEVLQLMQTADLDRYVGQFPINATLQLLCRDHEFRNGEFILRACRVLSG